MKCPYCQDNMKKGSVEISGSLASFFSFGVSTQNMYFAPFDEKYQEFSTQKEKIAEETKVLLAHKCENCKAVVFIPGKGIDYGCKVGCCK